MALMAIVAFNDGERRTPQHVCVYVFMDFCFFGIYVGMSCQFMFVYICDENENEENNRVSWLFSVFR